MSSATSTTLSFKNRRWIIRDATAIDPTPDLAHTLAAARGISINNDRSAKLSDPFLFPEMTIAVERIERAIGSGETIGIFGDYDADGITGTAQLVHAFRRRNIEPIVYLPDRAQEGYGLKKGSVDTLHAQGVTLLITVDTGISAGKEIAYASSLGIDTIVTDHHHAHGGRPTALAVIHPQVPSAFPNPHLCGSGVAFMLVRALERGAIWNGIDRDIVLATIGTIGDVVPLTGENRTLVRYGLAHAERLAGSPLRDLLDSVSQRGPLTSTDIAFKVVPRINAAGRMEHPKIALDALLQGGDALERLHALNTDRQSLVTGFMETAMEIVGKEDQFLVALSCAFTAGTVGLVAGKLTEATGKPSLAGALRGDDYVASLRSIESVDLMACLTHPEVKPYLKSFGGHRQAAGCSFAIDDSHKVLRGLQFALIDQDIIEPLQPSLTIDRVLTRAPNDLSMIRAIDALQPFGAGNPEPLFLLRSVPVTDLRAVGSESKHLQCRIDGLKAIAFHGADLAEPLNAGGRFDVVCRLGINRWNGREELQAFVEDVRAVSFER